MPPDCEERQGADRSREQVFEDRFGPLLNGSSLHKAPIITSTTNPWIGDELPINDDTDLGLSDHSEDRSDVNILSAGLDVEHHHKILMNRKKRRILASSGNFSLVCKICSKEFSTGRALGGHMRIHSNNSSKSEESESEEEEEEEEANWSVISGQMDEKKRRRRRRKKKKQQKNHLDLDMAERCYVNLPHESNLMDEEEEIIVHNYDYQTTHPNHNYSNQSIHGDGDKLFCVDQVGMIHDSNKQRDMADKKTKKKTKKKKKYYYMSKEYSHEHGDDLQDRNGSAGFASEAKDQETLMSGKAEEKKKKQKKQKKDEPAQENMDHDHKGGRISRNGSNICPVCSRDFMSQKALFGHMRSHPERQWRGIQPPAPALIPVHQDNDRLSHDSNPNGGRSNGSTVDLSVSDKSSPTGSSSASSHQPYNHHHHRFKLLISNKIAPKPEAHHQPQAQEFLAAGHEDHYQFMNQEEEEPEPEPEPEEEEIHHEEIQEAGFDDQNRLLKGPMETKTAQSFWPTGKRSKRSSARHSINGHKTIALGYKYIKKSSTVNHTNYDPSSQYPSPPHEELPQLGHNRNKNHTNIDDDDDDDDEHDEHELSSTTLETVLTTETASNNIYITNADVEVESDEKRLPAASDSIFVHLGGMPEEFPPHDQCDDGHDQDGNDGGDGDIHGNDGHDHANDGHGHGNDGHGHGGMKELNVNKPAIIMNMKRNHGQDHDIDLARCLLLLSNGGIDVIHQDQEDQEDEEGHGNGVNQVLEFKQPHYIVPDTENHRKQLFLSESTATTTTTNGEDPFARKRPDTVLFGLDLKARNHRQVPEYSSGHAIRSDRYSVEPNDNEYAGPNGTYIIGEASGVNYINGLDRVLETMKITRKQEEGPLHIITSDIINVRKVDEKEEEDDDDDDDDDDNDNDNDDNDMNVIYENEVHVNHENILSRLYVCSGCKKSFGSPQALGGHRASHKKKNGCYAKDQISLTSSSGAAAAYNSRSSSLVDQEQLQQHEVIIMHGLEEAASTTNNSHGYANLGRQEDSSSATLERMKKKYSAAASYSSRENMNNTTNMQRHECSVCHRIFATGQALGGHKRCHWTGGKSPPHVAVAAAAGAEAHQIHINPTSALSTNYKGIRLLIDQFIREGHHRHPISSSSSPIQQLHNATITGAPYTTASTVFNDSKVSDVVEETEHHLHHHHHHHHVGLDLNLPAPLDDVLDDDDDNDEAKNRNKVEYIMIKSHNDHDDGDGDGNNFTFRQSSLHSFMPGLCPPPSNSNPNPQEFDTNWSRTPTLINYHSFNRDQRRNSGGDGDGDGDGGGGG